MTLDSKLVEMPDYPIFTLESGGSISDVLSTREFAQKDECKMCIPGTGERSAES